MADVQGGIVRLCMGSVSTQKQLGSYTIEVIIPVLLNQNWSEDIMSM